MKTRLSKKNTSIDISRLWGFYSELNIELYNLRGQCVDKLKIENVKCKINSVVWDGSGFASGIYLYKLNLENSPIKKMILLK